MENEIIKTTTEKDLERDFIKHIEQREKEIAKHPNEWITLEELKKELEKV